MPPPRIDWLAGATFAHRGLHDLRDGGLWVENSPSAFRAAIAAGFGIECDVRLSADGVAMVFHDATLERLTHAQGPLTAQPAAVLRRIPLAGTRDTITSLAEVLVLVDGRVPLLIEVKRDGGAKAAALCAGVALALAGYHGPHAVMSFDPRVPAWFARHHPATPRGLVMRNADTPGPMGPLLRHLALWRARPDFCALDIADLPSHFAARQRAAGIRLASWTVNSPELLARARACVDAVIAEGAGLPEAAHPAPALPNAAQA